ncbi:YncE family protein [Streptomyces sp. NPDC056361]|uniref:YncE family protein n=1 Tax=Streptomyces sp. NPDC056361 TaxID=3345795 RepID=UPI0035DA33DE
MSETFHTEILHVGATIPVGVGPVGVAVDVHNQVFVTNSASGTVSVVTSTTNTVTTTIGVGFGPVSVATDPQFGVFVANAVGSTVSVIDRFNHPLATLDLGGPSGPPPGTVRVAVDHIPGRAYVTQHVGHRMSTIHTSANPPLVWPFAMEVPGPLGIAIDTVKHVAYVTQPDLDTVSVVDPVAHEVTATFSVGHRPTGIAIDAQKRRAYVANSGFTTVSIINMTTGAVHDVDVASHPVAVAVDTKGNAYVSLSDGAVRVIDAESSSTSAAIPVGSQPEGLVVEPHSNRLYVANRGDGTVSVIDLAGG